MIYDYWTVFCVFMRNVNHSKMADPEDNSNKFLNPDSSQIVVSKSTPYSRKKQEIFHLQNSKYNFHNFQLLATVCTTLGCLLNGTAIAYTGPALPSLLNITGEEGDGRDIWAGDIVINAQEASWISETRSC